MKSESCEPAPFILLLECIVGYQAYENIPLLRQWLFGGMISIGVCVMNWKKERDLLIAQTMAFVQSVTGKTPDLEQALDAKSGDAKPEDAKPDVAAPFSTAEQVLAAAPVETTRIKATEPVEPAVVELSKEIKDIQASIKVPRALASGDVRSEMQARVANFRAHQERFSREREEYFSVTLAKARATIDSTPDSTVPTPPTR